MARPRVRQQLLNAAAALLTEQGAGALTSRAVAQRAGVSEASLFNNFGDKAGLLRALLQETGEEYPAFLAALAAPATPLEGWLVEVLGRARAWFRRVLPLTAPLLGNPPPNHPGPPEQASYAVHQALSLRLTELHASGQLPRLVDAQATAVLLLGAALHTTLSELTQGDHALASDESSLAVRLARSLGLL